MKPIQAKIAGFRSRLMGTPFTEPIFGYMFDALGMQVEQHQLSVMNNTEPSASDVAAFRKNLKTHQVKLFVFDERGLRSDRGAGSEKSPRHPQSP